MVVKSVWVADSSTKGKTWHSGKQTYVGSWRFISVDHSENAGHVSSYFRLSEVGGEFWHQDLVRSAVFFCLTVSLME